MLLARQTLKPPSLCVCHPASLRLLHLGLPFMFSKAKTTKQKEFIFKWKEQVRGKEVDEKTESVSSWAQLTPVGYS